jgi:hypothetical protein
MSMIRLHISAEGRTEQVFVEQILCPHLAPLHIWADARAVRTSRDNKRRQEHRGGLVGYQRAKADIIAWMKEDRDKNCRFTTMFDLYALPNDFPEFAKAKQSKDPYQRVAILEQALAEDIADPRFFPYIQLHEFEALILADPQKLDWEYLEHERAIQHLLKSLGNKNPELINDGPTTAPSKRILKEIPEYDKVSAGVAVVERIGLATIRSKCQHFNAWLTYLENLGAPHE